MTPMANALAYQKEYFEFISEVRAAALIKFFDAIENEDGGIPALAVEFRRTDDGSVAVSEAVSFGSAPLPERTRVGLQGLPLRELPLVSVGKYPRANWFGHRATVTIPAVDIFAQTSEESGIPINQRPSLELDIREIYKRPLLRM